MNFDFEKMKKDVFISFLSLDKYKYLNERLFKCDVSKDSAFKTAFNSFYRVRRDEKWRKTFYSYFEEIKYNRDITFDEILEYFFKKTGNVEASFSSKLLATINPDMPILDSHVLKNMDLKITGSTPTQKLESAKEVYIELIEKEKNMLKKESVRRFIKEFRTYIPEYELTDIKILDYLLWI